MDATTPLRVRHAVYGLGVFQSLLAPAGHARVQFDIDGGIPRRVLRRDFVVERDGGRQVEDHEVAS